MEPTNRPKPSMGDIKPRRSMDMSRPASQPMPTSTAPRVQSQRPVSQAPIQRPQPLPPRPLNHPAQGVRQAPIAPANQAQISQPKTIKPPKVRKSHPFWRGLLQVIVSLLVIVGVAAVIVALYLKYYQ